ncbi:AbrB family transcriptional regulator [Macrococcus carouselicus]|uniref:AbrB family transcriptional regulator n=1 Tax=Macrococcus carouselicus TaxID=69969 RepID=A0A9Q8FR60_9STAP|nr:AbrB family transcriptional regulator [Macrococcus carouselicus]TDM04463.1 AbrB family transcriptional regulator [Macrococcus carouselicus]
MTTIVVIVAVISGYVLMKIGMFLPWLFGPILAAVSVSRTSSKTIRWPRFLGDLGLFILGTQIGATFTMHVLKDIRNDLFSIILLNIMIIGAAVILSLIFRRITDCTYETAVLSAIPGALSQMIVMAEENKRADLLAVTLSQTSRLLFVVMSVPFIASFSGGDVTGQTQRAQSVFDVLNWDEVGFMAAMITAVFLLLRRIHFPVPQLLAPIFAVTVWNLMTGEVFSVPYALIAAAQLMFGVRIGLQVVDLSSQLSARLFIGIAVQNTLLIVVTFILAFLFSAHDFNDLFLSLAPGGMAQIIIVALESGGNIAMISSYHIFRIFFILLVIAPLLQVVLKRFDKGGQIS